MLHTHFGRASRVAAILLAAGVTACGRPPLLARGPINLSDRPLVVALAPPVVPQGSLFELCVEFDRPGESFWAASLEAVFISSAGVRERLRDASVDRRGEARVCRIGRLTPPPAGTTFDRVELRTEVPVVVREIRGGSRK